MRIIDFMKKNKDKTFVFVLYDGIIKDDGSITLEPNIDDSYCFRGYNAFVNFKSDNRAQYRRAYKPLLKSKIDKDVEPYYLDDSSVVFANLYSEGEHYWAKKSYFEEYRSMTEHLKEFVQGCTDVTKKVG